MIGLEYGLSFHTLSYGISRNGTTKKGCPFQTVSSVAPTRFARGTSGNSLGGVS